MYVWLGCIYNICIHAANLCAKNLDFGGFDSSGV